MADRLLRGTWTKLKREIIVRWPEVSANDVAPINGDRDALMRLLKSRSTKSYAQIDREIAEFEVKEQRHAFANRLSGGIGPG